MPLRTIVESERVQKSIDEAIESKAFNRLDDVFEGFKWRLARDPESGFLIPDVSPEKFILKINPIKDDIVIPGLRAIYSFTEQRVDLEIIEIF